MNTRTSPLDNLQENMRIPGDNPIRNTRQDVLQRAGVAEKFALQVCRLDATEGSVVAVFGPWGSGKTSFIHLSRKTFEDERVPVLDFNPWLFSGTEQLVGRFVTELSAQFKLNRLDNLCNAFLEYGDSFSGKWGVLARISMRLYLKWTGGFETRREKVTSVLRKRNKPIIVVLDDVDRLTAPEIREIFKLVRLTASFPNLIYIVCCDRLRVEQALGEETAGLPGRDYLEKIIQLPFQLPEVPRHLLAGELHNAIEDTLTGIENPGPVNEGEWPDFFDEIIRPHVRNMRDVRRYAIAVRHTLEDLDGQVARNDVLALEAIRIFLPNMFRCLPGSINFLTLPGWFVYEQHEELMMRHEQDPMLLFNRRFKSQVGAVIEAAGGNGNDFAGEFSRTVVNRLFPVAGEHLFHVQSEENYIPDTDLERERLNDRRVAHAHILRLYLERVRSPDLEGNHHAEHVISLMADRDSLRDFIHSLKPAEWYSLISNLDLSERRIQNDHLETVMVVLLERWAQTPNQLTDWILLNTARSKIQQIIGPILNALADSDEADAMVLRILDELESLSSRLLLVEMLRDCADSGTYIVSESALQGYENMLQDNIIHASIEVLTEESDLMRILYFAKGRASSSGRPYHTDGSWNELTITVLLSSLREKIGSVFLDGLPVNVLPELDSDGLVKLYGDVQQLGRRIHDLESGIGDLNSSIERRIPYDDFRKLLDLADLHLKKEQPDHAETST